MSGRGPWTNLDVCFAEERSELAPTVGIRLFCGIEANAAEIRRTLRQRHNQEAVRVRPVVPVLLKSTAVYITL